MMPRAVAFRRTAVALVSFASLAAVSAVSCNQETVTVDVRSLERSGRSAFLCLGAPGEADGPSRPLTDCSRARSSSVDDYGVDESGKSTLPHLYALVTQTTRGEVAVIDVTTEGSAVLDQDPGVPGANFLPVGAQPIDLVTTPGGTAAFVSVAEIGREGLFAIPASMVRPSADRPPPRLSSWPACSLPSAPGDIVVVADPAQGEVTRASCDGAYDTPTTGSTEEGRLKLVVAMPEQGGFIVVDAQTLLDLPPGGYDPCPVERWVPLQADLPPQVLPVPSTGLACVSPEVPAPSAESEGKLRPAGMTYSDGRLYIADLEAPVIHVIDMPTPCEPVERAPLLPTSLDEPERVVTTLRVAVSRTATPEFRRYLYAVDADDGSLMVFDISDGAVQPTPITRPHPEWNPFYPADRIRFSAPVRDLLIVERDAPVVDPETGVAVSGLRCDPNPTLDACANASDTSCDLETLYRTAEGYDSGAGPLRLRGTFAFALLTNGRIGIVDIDDLDAACRAPKLFSEIQGCSAVGPSGFSPPEGAPADDIDADGVLNDKDNCPYQYNPGQEDTFPKKPSGDPAPDGRGDRCDVDLQGLRSSGEASCNVVLPNAPRSANYLTTRTGTSDEPGLQTLPILYDASGTALAFSEDLPLMRAVLGGDPGPAGLALAVAGKAFGIDEVDGLIPAYDTPQREEDPFHTLAMNLEDPRAHVVDQGWTVTYEGELPGFGGNFATLTCVEGCEGGDALQKRWDIFDDTGLFCGRGVQSYASVLEQLVAEGADDDSATQEAASRRADFVTITTDIPSETAAYWTQTPPPLCSYDLCNRIYNSSTGVSARELIIREAYQDHLVLERPDLVEVRNRLEAAGGGDIPVELADMNCCFPGSVQFEVRARAQWIVNSQATGFLHHVIADPATGVCRNSCDQVLARMNGRVRPAPPGEPVFEGDAAAFRNPMFRFAISNGIGPCRDNPAETCVQTPQRDMQFRFVTQGSFEPLFINLSSVTADLQPTSMRIISATGDLAITDGSLEGLILVNPATLDVSRQFY